MKILVVDDEKAFVSVLVEALSPYHEVFGTTESTNLVGQVRTGEYEMVILDLILQDGNGVSLLAELKQSLPDIRIIAITGTIDDSLHERAVAVGADEFLLKLVQILYLRKLIDRFEASRKPRSGTDG